jgi:putative membrane protein
MNAVGLIFALIAALIHVYIFVLESVLFPRPSAHKTFGVTEADLPAVRPWAFNQGFYNLFLAVIAVVGVILHDTAGKALVGAACGSMLAAALVLLATNRRMLRAAAVQGLAPLIALVSLFF